MDNHVKLEVAIQIAAERIANLYNAIDKAETSEMQEFYTAKLQEAFVDKDLVAVGHIPTIEKILQERRGDDNE